MHKTVFVFLLLFLISCERERSQPSISGEMDKVSAQLMQERQIRIDVKEINDSRCPLDCRCATEGYVRVVADISLQGTLFQDVEFFKSEYYSLEGKDVFEYDHVQIILEDVNPYPELWKTVEKSAIFKVLEKE